MTLSRVEINAMETAGICPECRVQRHDSTSTCRKYWFDRGYSTGYHDGRNHMGGRHDSAFEAEMIESDEWETNP